MNRNNLFSVIFKILVGVFIPIVTCGQYVKILNLDQTTHGVGVNSVIANGNFLYGMTSAGGTSNLGTVFKVKKDGTSYFKLHDFTGGTDGANPNGGLFFDGTYLYGMTKDGGNYNLGIIFKILPDGFGYTKLKDFTGTSASGALPVGGLTSDGIFLYGMTQQGGIDGTGTIFKLKPDGSDFLEILELTFFTGYYPHGDLLFDNGYLYGTSSRGGVNNLGTVFKVKTDGTDFSKLVEFNGTSNGKWPTSTPIADSVYLYGTTTVGGTNDFGVVFKVKRDGTDFSKIFDFDAFTTGGLACATLVSDGNYLYGTTIDYGSTYNAVIYKLDPDGNDFTILHVFNNLFLGVNPSFPGPLAYDGNSLYGTSRSGGTNNFGVLYKFNNPTFTELEDVIVIDDFKIYPNPAMNEIYIQKNMAISKTTLPIKIYNILGKIVLDLTIENTEKIDLSYLPSGLYTLEVDYTKRKFIKQ